MLYEENYEKMIRVAYRMVGSMESAQDLVQEAFLLALFYREKLADHPSPEGWLMLTLKNLARNERRRVQAHPTAGLDDVDELHAPSPPAPLDTVLPRQLRPEDRRILLWRFEQNMSHREIADRLGISESGCRSRVARAVARCRKLMGIR